jgi:hypothetical protein
MRAIIDKEVHGNTFEFISMEMLSGKTVKGAPYSAEAVTETVQVLGDGNRIVRKSSSMLYRDSEGRERREQSIEAIGAMRPKGDPEQTIFISDPVAKVSYVLHPTNRTAEKSGLTFFKTEGGTTFTFSGRPNVMVGAARAETERGLTIGAATAGNYVIRHEGVNEKVIKRESLGKRNIEGVEAEGVRTTHTIAAGEIGNDRPIDVVSERWFSEELQMVVMSRNSDPRTGETTYKLTRINRSEPLRSMFEIPSDYNVKDLLERRRVTIKDEI